MIKEIYLKNPTISFLFEEYISKARIEEDCIINDDNNELQSFYSLKYDSKIDFLKGYKKIIINENDYLKKFLKYNKVFCYGEKKYLKGVKYFNQESSETLELKNKENKINDFINYYFITIVLDYNDGNIKYLNDNGFTDIVTWYELTLISRKDASTKDMFNKKIEELKVIKEKPSLLIHSCCGPCSSYCLELLEPLFDITILYYNPNITPNDEYLKRLDEQRKIIECLGLDIKIITKDYDHQDFFKAIKGIDDQSEGGERCFACYAFRLEETCKIANENNYDYFTTTLSISPYKNSSKINEIGLKLQEKYNCNFLYSNFKLNDGYKKSIALSKKYNLYRQDYCGCEYSLKFKMKEK